MTGRRVTRASSLAATSESAQAAPSASAPKTPRGRSKKGGSTVARQSVVSKTTETYGSKGADQYIPQNTAGKSKEDVAVDFPDTASAHGSASGNNLDRSNNRAARGDKGEVGRNNVGGHVPNENSNVQIDNGTLLIRSPDVTLRHNIAEGDSRTRFRPNLKAWVGAIVVMFLIISLTNAPFFEGSKHHSVSTETSVLNGDAINQRLDQLELRMSDYDNFMPVIDQVSVAEKYQVDYFDPRHGAVSWPKYTSPEKMRKVGGWMGLFQKQVPFRYVWGRRSAIAP